MKTNLKNTRITRSGLIAAGFIVIASLFLLNMNLSAEKQKQVNESHQDHAHEKEDNHKDNQMHSKEEKDHIEHAAEGKASHDDEHKEDKDKHAAHETEAKTHDEHDDHKEGEAKGHADEKKEEHKEGGVDDGHGHEEEESSSDVELSKDQMKKAGIKTMRIKKQSISNQVSALSEVKLNQYKTINVSPPISTRVEKRHVRLGDYVKKGQLLVTLHTITSPDVKASASADKLTRADINASIATTIAEMEANIAQAKGELEAANATWDRLRLLGKDAIAGRRLTAAKIARNQAAAKLEAYQKSRAKIKQLGRPKATPPSFVEKHYRLNAEQSGMVIKDDFVLGQVVNPEDVLLVISDMNRLWVEANIKPNDASKINVGAQALINTEDKTLQGKVISIGRLIDEKTRTLAVRIQVQSKGVRIYPGQFVKTQISTQTSHEVIRVPSEAVLRSSDGDWMVFVEEKAGRFVPKEVDVVENLADFVVIEGIDEGTTIVSKGAFFVQSEFAKSGFSVHNH